MLEPRPLCTCSARGSGLRGAGDPNVVPVGDLDLDGRPTHGSHGVDMGAYESAFSGPPATPTPTASPVPTPGPTASPSPSPIGPKTFVVTKTADTNDGSCGVADRALIHI